MRRSTILPAAQLAAQLAALHAALLAASGTPAAAQDDFVAHFALHSTPVAALPPVAPASVADAGTGYSLRYGRLAFGDGPDAVHNVGFRVDQQAGRGRVGWTFGGQLCAGCAGLAMAGVDLQYPLRTTTAATAERRIGLAVALAPSFGVALPFSGGGVVGSAALAVPAGIDVPVGRRARLVPFVAPGIGLGAVVAGGGGASGMRPIVGGGVELRSGDGLGLSVGFQKVFVSGSDVQFGAGVAWRRAGASR